MERRFALILDDDVERHLHFRRIFERKRWPFPHVATTVFEAARRLSIYKYQYVFLDHDLGYTDSKATGMSLVQWIVNAVRTGKRRFSGTTFIVHSLNPVGAENMVQALMAVGLKVNRIPLMQLFDALLAA